MNKLCMTLGTIITFGLLAQGQNCTEISASVEMARAKSIHSLTEASIRAGQSYRARLVLAFRSFQLQPRSKQAAEHLLALIPTDDTQQHIVMTMGDSLCDTESDADAQTLAQIGVELPREWARAVLLVPASMHSYVSYSMVATLDPHSNYVVEMKSVCRKAHAEFSRTVSRLPEETKRNFTTYVMDPSDCRVIAVPERER